MAQIILDSANNLIQGDFDTATLSLRTRMQTSTTNATTGVYVVPNGSATSASVQVSNVADPTNASKLVVATNGSTDTQIVSGANGSGSYLPLSFYTNNDIRFQMGNNGELNVRTAPGTVSSGTSGQYLKSNGPGAGVSWGTVAAGGFSNMQVFTSPGTFTTPATVTQIKVTVVAGGGGGISSATGPNSGGAGGGGGGAAIYVGPVTASTGYAVTVGSAGSQPGGAGGTSSFAALASATGGSGATSGTGGAGGSGSAGTLQLRGGNGGGSPNFSVPGGSAGTIAGGMGGSSIFGAAGASAAPAPAGTPGGNYGGGGGGGGNASGNGGNGGPGVVIVEY
jgi:hypothetical protein